MTLKCDNHQERDAWNCSRWALQIFLCEECREKLKAEPRTSHKETWGRISEWSPDGRSYETGSAYGNPNAQYERKQFSGTNQGGKDE